MKPLIYLLLHRYLNNLKRIFKKPLSAIITVLSVVGLLTSMVFAFIRPQQELGLNLDVIVSLIVLGMGMMLINTMLASKQTGIFTLQDANLLFTAPIRPAYVLFSAILDVIPASFMTALFFTFYFPFLTGNQMGVGAYLLVLLLTTLLFAFVYLIFYIIYILDVARPGLRKIAKHSLWVILTLGLITFVALVAHNEFDLSATARAFFSSPYYGAFPIFGWVKWGIMGAIQGDYLTIYLPALLLMLAVNALIITGMINADVDFYEKALSDSYKINEVMQSAKNNTYDIRSVAKVKKGEASVRFRSGAGALLSMQLLEMKKTNSFFMMRELITGLIYLAIATFMDLGFTFAYMMILFMSLTGTMSDTWNRDFKKPYIYLIPESSLKKVIYSVLPGLMKSVLTGIVVVFIGAVAFRVPLGETIGYLIIYISLCATFIISDVLSYRVMGGIKSVTAQAFMRMLFMVAAAIPAAVIGVALSLLLAGKLDILYASPAVLLVNLGVCLIMAYLSRSLFEKSELA